MENEIQGGEKTYSHVQYGMMVTYREDRKIARFHKKPWVPQWIWNLLGTPDAYDMCKLAMGRALEKRRTELTEHLAAGGATKGKDGGDAGR